MFDVHLIHIIGNGVKYYKSDRRVFDGLFPHLGEVSKARMFTELNRKAVSFDTAYQNRKIGGLPLIIVENAEQSLNAQGFSDSAGMAMDTFGRLVPLSHIITVQTAAITIYADSPEMVRCFQTIIQAAMMLFRAALLKAQYENLMYEGSSNIGVETMLQGEGTSAYYRSMRYSAVHQLVLPTNIEDITAVGATPDSYTIEIIPPT